MTSTTPSGSVFARTIRSIARWFDTSLGGHVFNPDEPDRIDYLRAIPYFLMHVACLAVIWVGWSWTAVGVAIALYWVRMFAITGFYHRYFSHKTFRTSRACQFAFALVGCSATQRGPIWWAAHHRHHHLHSDEEVDAHSPIRHGFWWSHTLWFLSLANFQPDYRSVPDLLRYPELRFLNRFDLLVPVALAVGLFFFGWGLEIWAPALGTGAWQMLIWGFFISTVVLAHGTFTVNSLTHLFGTKRFVTTDESRNNWLVALITMGEGWHNNHHYCQSTVHQGFAWYEFDPTYWVLRAMSWAGLVSDLRPIPAKVLEEMAHAGAGPVETGVGSGGETA